MLITQTKKTENRNSEFENGHTLVWSGVRKTEQSNELMEGNIWGKSECTTEIAMYDPSDSKQS